MNPDEEQFRNLYDRYYDEIYRYFVRRGGAASAQDLVAEVFLVAWRRISDMPAGDEALLWLYGVARNLDAHKRRTVARGTRLDSRLRSVPPPETEEPDVQILRRSEYDRVIAAAARLREGDQEILRLAAWEELPHSAISDLLGCSVAAVDQRLHRAKKRLVNEYNKVNPLAHLQSEEGGG